MSMFGVNPVELVAAAAKIIALLGEYEQVVSTVKAHADDINSKWEGQAKQTFEQQMQNADTYLRQLRPIVQEYATYLQKTAKDYEEKDLEASGIIRKLNA